MTMEYWFTIEAYVGGHLISTTVLLAPEGTVHLRDVFLGGIDVRTIDVRHPGPLRMRASVEEHTWQAWASSTPEGRGQQVGPNGTRLEDIEELVISAGHRAIGERISPTTLEITKQPANGDGTTELKETGDGVLRVTGLRGLARITVTLCR